MSLPDTQTILTGLLIGPGGSLLKYLSSSKSSSFSNVPEKKFTISTNLIIGIIVILILICLVIYFTCKAVYNLTDSTWQTVCYFLFGVGYLYFAVLYYGLSGYKFKLSNNSLNSRN